MLDQGNAPKFDARIYGKIALNDLVTYAVYYLTQIGEEITAEDIVAACFFMFPQRFSLRGYNQWPDSTVVNKRWVDCRDKHLISGNTANGFNLTPKGLELAEKTDRALKGERAVFSRKREGNVRSEMRTRAGRFVRALEDSDAYRAFNQSKASPSEFDFRSMLLCTMESSPDSVSTYLGETGTGHETPQGQVLLAELIVEAVCREIARRGVENGSFLAPSGAQTDAMQREYIRLQNQYAHVIHGCFVESRYRRDGPSQMRRGRPSREETLARAAVAG